MTNDAGLLHRPVSGGWDAPAVVHLNNTRTSLLWGEKPAKGPWLRPRRAAPGLLDEFISLAEAEPEGILKFAKRWGVLMRCPHDLAYGPAVTTTTADDMWCSECHQRFMDWLVMDQLDQKPSIFRESVAVWRKYALEFRSLLSLSADIHHDRTGATQHWDVIINRFFPEIGSKTIRQYPRSRFAAQAALSDALQKWGLLADVRVIFSWNPYADPQITLGGSLLGTLVLQVMLAAARVDSLAMCTACGSPYIPTRKPAEGRRSYCPACGPRAAWRDAKQAERDRRRALTKKKGR